MSEMTFEYESPEETEVETVETGRSSNSGLRAVATGILGVFCVAILAVFLCNMFMSGGSSAPVSGASVADVTIMDRFDMFVTNEISKALDGVVTIEKVYWLSDTDLVAPKPDEDNFGTANSPEELQWLLEKAAHLLEGQDTLFGMDTQVWSGDQIYYYYDETILVITWKEIVNGSVHTISEVKIADPSQFRRFLAGGEFGSDKQYTTTEMADSVNAVVASSGDFYKFRKNGIMVYGGEIMRMEGKWVDTCMIDDNGDLQFVYRKQIMELEDAEQFVEENNIRFSLAFGPVLVDNGEATTYDGYPLGEVGGIYSRSALCQMDQLHYLLVTMNGEGGYTNRQSLKAFAKTLVERGVQKAYALDGGQTAAIAMQGETINRVDYGYQRQISDIIYFATALPNGD